MEQSCMHVASVGQCSLSCCDVQTACRRLSPAITPAETDRGEETADELSTMSSRAMRAGGIRSAMGWRSAGPELRPGITHLSPAMLTDIPQHPRVVMQTNNYTEAYNCSSAVIALRQTCINDWPAVEYQSCACKRQVIRIWLGRSLAILADLMCAATSGIPGF